MQNQYTFFDLIIDVFTIVKSPLSPDEIWEKAIELGALGHDDLYICAKRVLETILKF